MDNAAAPAGPYTMPTLGAGAFGRPPFRYRKSEELIVTFRTDPDRAREIVPPGVEIDDKALGIVRFVRHAASPFGPYRGAYLAVTASIDGAPIAFVALGVKTDFASVAAGREIWGMPLKLGDVAVERSDVDINADATVDGHRVCSVRLRLGEPMPAADAAPQSTRPGCFLKIIPAADGSGSSGQLVAGAVDDSVGAVATAWSVDGVRLEFPSCPATDPWDALPVLGPVRARVLVGGEIVLDHGRVLRTYAPGAFVRESVGQ